MAHTCHLIGIARLKGKYPLPFGVFLPTETGYDADQQEQKPGRNKSSFPLHKRNCSHEWFPSICCVEIGVTKLDGSRFNSRKQHLLCHLPEGLDPPHYQLPHHLVTQRARHTVGMIENISFPTHTLTPISLGQNCLVFSDRSGGHAGSSNMGRSTCNSLNCLEIHKATTKHNSL